MNTNTLVTAGAKSFLEEAWKDEATKRSVVDADSRSVLEHANTSGMSLQQYVASDPDTAVRQAEASLLEWLNIQAAAAVSGVLETGNGTVRVSREMVNLINARVAAAQKQLSQVNEYAITTIKDGELRKDHIIRTLYNRAIQNNSVSAMRYLIDRVDGRPETAQSISSDVDNAYNVYQIIHSLFDKQLEVLNSGNGTKLICCSRRSGKTLLLVALELVEALRKPNTTCVYIGETTEQTELIFTEAADQIINSCNLKDKRGNRLNWRKLDNGSHILISGLTTVQDPDRIRGHKAKVIVIDEFFHLKDGLLGYLVKEVLQPMQMDYANDYKFVCAGTPPSIKGTYGEHAWKTWEVPHYFWTWEDNPHPVDVEARRVYIENVLKEKGLDWTSTYARREYRGEWIYDEDLLLYPEYHAYDPRESIPQFNVDMVLFALDYGVSDYDALIGIAWDSTARRGYVFHEDKFNRLDITDRTISQLEYLRGQVRIAWMKALEFFPNLDPREANKRILWDADDNNQHLTDDFNINIRLPQYPDLRLNIQNAHKTDIIFMQDKIKDLLRSASLLLVKGGKTAEECEKTVLTRGPAGQVYPQIDSKVYHPDMLPAMRYALWNVIGQEAYGERTA